MLEHIRLAIKVLPACKRFREQLHLLHAIEAKQPVPLSQAAETDQIPAPPPAGQTIWLDCAVSERVVVRTIVDSDAVALLNRFAEINQERGIRPCLLLIW